MVSIVKTVLSNGVVENIPLLGELISDLIIAPYLLIFTTRVLGFDRSTLKDCKILNYFLKDQIKY